MCFSSIHGTFALHSICCWWLPNYLHGLPGASQLLRVVAQSNHWWLDSFASFSWPSFDHSVLLTAVAWENRETILRAILTLTLFLYTHRKSKWAMGLPHMGRGSCPRTTEASEDVSLWNPRTLRNNFMCHCVFHLYAKCFYMPLLGHIIHLCVCVCAHTPESIPYNMQVSDTMHHCPKRHFGIRGRSRFLSFIIPAQAHIKWDG